MFTRLIHVLTLCVFLGGALSAHADEETNRELAKTYANFHIRNHDFKAAQQILAAHLEQDAADVEAWNLMGLASMEINDYDAAKRAFHAAAQDEKAESRGIYLYHYADVLARSGDVEHAKDALKLASQYFQVAESVKVAQAKLESGKKLPALFLEDRARWSKQVSFSTGYDTNVLMAPNVSLANINPSSVGSPNAMLMAKLNVLKPKFTREIEGTFVAATQYQTNSNASQFSSIYSGLTGEYRENGDEFSKTYWRVPVKADVALLNLSGYQVFNWNGGLQPKFGFRLSGTSSLEFDAFAYYRWFYLLPGSASTENRTGLGAGGVATYKSFWGAWEWSAGLKFDNQMASGSNFFSYSYLIPIQLTSPYIFWDCKFSLKSEQGFINYPSSSYGRQDTIINPVAMLYKKFDSQWTGTFTLGSIMDSSTVSFATYNKIYATVMAAYDF